MPQSALINDQCVCRSLMLMFHFKILSSSIINFKILRIHQII